MDPAVNVGMVAIVVVGSALYASYECATMLTTTVFWGRRSPWLMSGGLDVPRSIASHPARHLASTARKEGTRRTQQQSVPPQVPQVGHAGGETGRRASIRRPMLVASVADAKMLRRGILHRFANIAPSLVQ